MNTDFDIKRRTFSEFNTAGYYLLYLNEKPATMIPEVMESEESVADPEPVEGFTYTGTESDGGTLIQASEASYEAFTSGLIRLRYSADEVEAINTNMVLALQNKKHERAAEFTERFNEFQAYREECKTQAKDVIERNSDEGRV